MTFTLRDDISHGLFQVLEDMCVQLRGDSLRFSYHGRTGPFVEEANVAVS